MIADSAEGYVEITAYRSGRVLWRLQSAWEDLRVSGKRGRKLDTIGHKEFVQESVDMLQHTDR